MDTGTIIALSFGGGAVFGFILAIISICIDRRCGRKKGSLFADEGSPKVKSDPEIVVYTNIGKRLSPLEMLSEGTGSQVSDLPDDCPTPSISETVLVCTLDSTEHKSSSSVHLDAIKMEVCDVTDEESLESVDLDDIKMTEGKVTKLGQEHLESGEHLETVDDSEMIKSEDSSVGSIFQYMNALLSDRIVENLSTSERQNILTLIARRFEKTKEETVEEPRT
ncbi:uncharacterized protein LOC134815820 [Bolinopsis microptera]|uniref:uncharacterized protein LOC134815820 n=1 Tax=Bolinopsis microptera TaxID=2820187 RepID=UPI003079202B